MPSSKLVPLCLRELVAVLVLQVGCVAMLIASKYEEIYAPEIQDFIYISDRAYTRSQILAMEVHMLNALNYEFTVPTCYMFANRYLKAVNRY